MAICSGNASDTTRRQDKHHNTAHLVSADLIPQLAFTGGMKYPQGVDHPADPDGAVAASICSFTYLKIVLQIRLFSITLHLLCSKEG
jgi:hypothetical protein